MVRTHARPSAFAIAPKRLGVEWALRSVLSWKPLRDGGPRIIAMALAASAILAPGPAGAEGLFDLLFGGLTKLQPQHAAPQANSLLDPSSSQPAPQPRTANAGGSGPAFCVRSCDGRYFPLMRSSASPVQMCQAFCPASATRVYYGSAIDYATAANGERYADSENAYAYRKALRADCTCNGRDPAGLAPVDLALDSSLRPGDVVATTEGLVAYSGPRGTTPTTDFTPVAAYQGLTSQARARLTEMKVAPVRAETVAGDMPVIESSPVSAAAPMSIAPKPAPAREKRAAVN